MTNEEALEAYRQKIEILKKTESAQSRKIQELFKLNKHHRVLLQRMHQALMKALEKKEKE